MPSNRFAMPCSPLLGRCQKNLVRYIEYLTTQTFENQLLTLLAVCLKSYLVEVTTLNKINNGNKYETSNSIYCLPGNSLL